MIINATKAGGGVDNTIYELTLTASEISTLTSGNAVTRSDIDLSGIYTIRIKYGEIAVAQIDLVGPNSSSMSVFVYSSTFIEGYSSGAVYYASSFGIYDTTAKTLSLGFKLD